MPHKDGNHICFQIIWIDCEVSYDMGTAMYTCILLCEEF